MYRCTTLTIIQWVVFVKQNTSVKTTFLYCSSIKVASKNILKKIQVLKLKKKTSKSVLDRINMFRISHFARKVK